MKIDLLGMIPPSQGSSSLLKAWRNTWNVSDSEAALFDLWVPGLVTDRLADLFPVSTPPSTVPSANWLLHTAMQS